MRIYQALFGFHVSITALIVFSSVVSLLGIAGGGRARGSEAVLAVVLPLVLGGTAYAAWVLQRDERPGAAAVVLVGFWGLAALAFLYALTHARWN